MEVKNNKVIKLIMAFTHHMDKQGSEFIYIEDLGVWMLKSEMDKVNIETDDVSNVPNLSNNMLDQIGVWEEVKS